MMTDVIDTPIPETAPAPKAARRAAKITKDVINGLTIGERPYMVWDTDLKGFGVKVFPSGVKTYIARFRPGGGRRAKQREFVIARHGELTPDKARDEAEKVLAQVRLGDDPQLSRTEKRAEMTVAELCDVYLTEGAAHKKSSTIALDRIRISRHIKPTIGAMRISEVRRAEVERLMRDVSTGKIRNEATPHTRGGKGAAARTVGLLGGIYAFAVGRRLVTESPTVGVKRPPDAKRERFLSGEEINRLADTIGGLADPTRERKGLAGDTITVQHQKILQLLLLTGCRKDEIVSLKWREVDLETGFLRLGDSKTGARVVTLGAAAVTVIESIDRTKSPWVFPKPGAPDKPVDNLDWAWVCIRERAAMADVRIHDLRHTFASVAAMGGKPLLFVGKLLGHKHTQTTARYAHLADDPLKAAADSVSNQIAAAMKGGGATLTVIGGGQ